MSKPGSGRGLRCLDNSANHSGEARGARSGGFDECEKRWGAFLAKELARRAITTQRNSRRKFLPQLGRLLRRRIQRQLRFNQRHFAHNYSGRLQIWPDVVDSLSTLTSTFKGGLGGTLHLQSIPSRMVRVADESGGQSAPAVKYLAASLVTYSQQSYWRSLPLCQVRCAALSPCLVVTRPV